MYAISARVSFRAQGAAVSAVFDLLDVRVEDLRGAAVVFGRDMFEAVGLDASVRAEGTLAGFTRNTRTD
jgi:hypothetical protein